MKNLKVQFILFLFLTFFVSTQVCLADYDEDKIIIVLDGHYLINKETNPATVKEGAVELVRSLVQSGKYNVATYDNYAYNVSASVFNAINAEIRASLDNPSDLLTTQEIQNINDNAFYPESKYYYSRDGVFSTPELFSEVVKKEMDPDTTQAFSARGSTFDFSGMEELIFSLGPVALADDFSLSNIEYNIDYSKSPPQCQVKTEGKTYDLDESICLENLEMEYRWINQGNRECGQFVKGQQRVFRNVTALLCEPQHVQNFENYFQANLLLTCQSSQDCLSGISGQALQDLSSDFLAIMVETKVQELREKAYADATFEFRAQFEQLLDEVASFNLVCEKLGIDAMVLGRLSEDETERYEERINEINSAFSEEISSVVSNSLLDVLRDNGSYYYKKCILTQKEQGNSDESRDGFFEECERSALSSTLSELLRKLAIENGGGLEEIESLVKSSLGSMCSFDEEVRGSYRERPSLDQFDYRYDMNRCVTAMDRIISNFEAYAGLSSAPLRQFNQNLRGGVEDSRVDVLLRQNTQECLEKLRRRDREDSTKIQQCYEQAVVTTRAETIVESIILSTSNSSPVRRDASLVRDVIELSRTNSAIEKCLNSEAVTRSELQSCMTTVRVELAEKLPTGLFSGHANSAAAALQADLELLTKTLTREISVFHWASDELTNNSADEVVPLTSWGAYKYAVGREYMFHVGPMLNSIVSGQGTGTMAGRGLYAASDPNSTRQYGNTLFEIRVPEESRFLDLREGRSEGEIPISKDTYDKLVAEGCDLNSSNRGSEEEISARYAVQRLREENGYYALVSKSLFEQNGACHDVFSEAVSNLNVNFLAYSYGSSPASFCDNSAQNRPAAFVMIDNRMRGNVRNYNTAQITAAIKSFEETGQELPVDIRRILQLNTEIFNTNDQDYREQVDSEAINYWKSRLFSCDESYEEDRLDRGL